MTLLHSFILFALCMAASTEALAITGVQVLERYSEALMVPYHGPLEEQGRQEENKKNLATSAVMLITTGTLFIGEDSLPSNLPRKELDLLKHINKPPFTHSKHFGISKERRADTVVKTLYMELILAAFWLEIDIKPLLASAMKSLQLQYLCGPGKHLSLIEEFWDMADLTVKGKYEGGPIPYFEYNLDPKRVGVSRTEDATLHKLLWKTKNLFPSICGRIKDRRLIAPRRGEKRELDRYAKYPPVLMKHEFRAALTSENYIHTIQRFFQEFSGAAPIHLIRRKVCYLWEPQIKYDPKLGCYRTLVDVGARFANDTGDEQYYECKGGGVKTLSLESYLRINFINSHLNADETDPKTGFRWPSAMLLETPSGKKIPLLERPNRTSILFSYPAPFLVSQSIPALPTPLITEREEELFPYSVYGLLSLIDQELATVYPAIDVLTLYFLDEAHDPDPDQFYKPISISQKDNPYDMDMQELVKTFNFPGQVTLGRPFQGPGETICNFVSHHKNIGTEDSPSYVSASYIFECDVKEKTLIRKINCTYPISVFPLYVPISAHGYLCASGIPDNDGHNIFIFDMVKGKQITRIHLQNESLISKGINVNLGQLTIYDLTYFPNHDKLMVSFAPSIMFEEIQAQVIIDLGKLAQGLYKQKKTHQT